MLKELSNKLKGYRFFKKDIDAPTSIKKIVGEKQKKIVIYLTIGVAIMMVVGSVFFKSAPKHIKRTSSVNPIEITAKGDPLQHWTVESGATISDLKHSLVEQEQKGGQRKEEISKLTKTISSQRGELKKIKEMFQKSLAKDQQSMKVFRSQVSSELATTEHKQEALQSAVQQNPRLGSNVQGNSGRSLQGGIDAPSNLTIFSPPKPKISKSEKAKRVPNPYHAWLPMGSFFKATLLNGIVAPTGTSGQANPVPVIMKVMTNAILPNDRFRYKLRGCFIMGTGFGSVSSERVAIKLARISCIDKDGKSVVSSKIQGFIVDDDGKSDLRGKVINRQGSKIAMATLAGFAQGIGQMFGNSQGTSVMTPGGTGISLNTSQKLRGAGFNGIGQAANTVAQFYTKQAEAIYPVIAVNTGRNITVDLTAGLQLRWYNMSKRSISEKTLKRELSQSALSS